MKKKIYCKNKIIGEVIYQKNERKVDKLIKIICPKYSVLKEFFGFTIPQVKIHLLYSRAEINKYWGKKAPIWVCGFVKRKKIYILSPSISKKIINLPDNTIYKAIIHELVHLFILQINSRPLHWANEGLALFLADQIKNKKIKKSDWSFLIKNNFITNPNLEWSKIANKGGYVLSYLLVNYIILHYGKSKLIKLLKIKSNKKDISQDLEQVFKIKVDKFILNFQKELKFL